MRFWRKRNEGFEWKDYVRTTILVRRNERRQKVEDAKQAAIFGVKQAGRKGADAGVAGVDAVGRAGKVAGEALGRGSKAAASAAGRGAAAAGSALGEGAARAGSAIGHGAAAAARATASSLRAGAGALGHASKLGYGRVRTLARPHVLRAGQSTFDLLEPALNALLKPSISIPLAIVGLVAAAGGFIRWLQFGLDTDVIVAGTIAGLAAVLTLVPQALAGTLPAPLRAAGRGLRRAFVAACGLPGLNRISPRVAGLVLGSAAVVVAGVWLLWQPAIAPMMSLTANENREVPSAPSVAVTRIPDTKGRANALTGDTLKISGKSVKLAGIEAPEAGQRCAGASGSRSWRCGRAARDALAKLLRGQDITCKLAGEDESGLRLATCVAGEKDIAADLVRTGQVFAVPGFFARYSNVEQEARDARVGIWRADEVERPSEYRAKRWDEAKRSAPSGCPIKGRVASGARTYVLPWSSSYDSIRILERRGERWFCSEQEARAAGWRPTTL